MLLDPLTLLGSVMLGSLVSEACFLIKFMTKLCRIKLQTVNLSTNLCRLCEHLGVQFSC